MKVIVIAGTTESKDVIEQFIREGHEVLASTATERGSRMLNTYGIAIQEGRLDKQGFLSFFKKECPDKVMDASHPFAVEVTKNVREACELLKIPYERVERPKESYQYHQIIRVKNTEEAIEYLNQMDGNVLLTTGTKTLEQYIKSVQNGTERIFARVLLSGIIKERKNFYQRFHLRFDHLFFQDPPFMEEDTVDLIKACNGKVLVTKDSGKAGGVAEKIKAAEKCSIPVVLIERPNEKINEKKNKEIEHVKGDFKQNKKNVVWSIPRIMIAGTGSGCGKTTIMCALLKGFLNQEVKIIPFKCGPDYLDPMLHKAITGSASYNLDPFFMEEKDLEKVFYTYGKQGELAVVEGVMGFYDGMGLTTETSSYEVSEKLGIPVILVVSVKGVAATITACIKGMAAYRKNQIVGVLLNHCSENMYKKFCDFIPKETGLYVLGYLPSCADITIPSRHLGLMSASEIENLQEVIEKLGVLAESCFDLKKILEIAKGKNKNLLENKKKQNPINQFPNYIERSKEELQEAVKIEKAKVTIAIAWDQAFCFCYEDNLNYLKEQGAELLFFSPLTDAQIPKEADVLYFIGGYPELYARELSENHTMLLEIKKLAEEGIPIVAECGGYLYLCDSILTEEQKKYSMVGIIPQQIEMTKRLHLHFGYVNLYALSDGLLAKKGEMLKGHEFHYSKERKEFQGFCVEKPDKSRSWNGIYHTDTMYAGYPHFYFRSNEQAIKRLMDKAKSYQEKRSKTKAKKTK